MRNPVSGQVFAGVLIDNHFLEELAKDTDSFLAIIKEGNVIASTFSQKGTGRGTGILRRVAPGHQGLKGATPPGDGGRKIVYHEIPPLRDWEGNVLGFLVIGLSRGELTQTLSSLRRIILASGVPGPYWGSS